ncbi:hypothetical protein [Aestuariibaculum sediminum]|uniref:Uncharacterized protein n=1 Tax=Aestuariibaculum sediminum TaxID=2770637 RepID=A0A8J6Q992_9FLAO|nr:hypothetical protein [Aestuariibaculum sediminum]MBD0833763.1 hypothetical protein [Aestuariibaculum sediminum]
MATRSERQDYSWRPNDNSVSTQLKYELEAQHWHRAFKHADQKNKPITIGQDLKVIGLIFTLIVSILTWVVLLFIEVFRWLRSYKSH